MSTSSVDCFGGLPTGTSRQPGQRPHSAARPRGQVCLSVCLSTVRGRPQHRGDSQVLAELRAPEHQQAGVERAGGGPAEGRRGQARPPGLAEDRRGAGGEGHAAARARPWSRQRLCSGHSGGRLEEVRGCLDHTTSCGCPEAASMFRPLRPLPKPRLLLLLRSVLWWSGKTTRFLWVLFFLVS